MKKYLPHEIEVDWNDKWEKEGLYKFKLDSKKEKFYNLVELPYPSGDLHLGHWFAFVPPDVLARFKRMQGYNVFFPNGYDAFGLPAENAAIKRGIHPKDWTMSNIDTMTTQFKSMGTMIDWTHVVVTCEPEYYKWNQWIFLKLYEKGLAYKGKALSNWCPSCQTVLANENIEAGKCWRCGSIVEQKQVEQWFLKITEYADKLLWPEKPLVDWPKSVVDGQNTWIGKSSGIEIDFALEGQKEKVTAYTVYPETIFGVTYMVLAPEHPLVLKLTTKDKLRDVESYIKVSKNKTEMDRKENKEKTGVFTGAFVTNPANNQKVPVWVSDYVIWGYGTGAVMGVPGSDERDFEFAERNNLPMIRVIGKNIEDTSPVNSNQDILEEGTLVNSGQFNGLKAPQEAKEKVKDWMEKEGFGKRKVQYHIHDWSISRQRYWGTPVPMIHCDSCGIIPVPESDLPIELPYDVDFTPKGEPPLASNKEWLKVKCLKCGKEAKRDAETLDTFFDSAWYYYRYVDPKFKDGPFDARLVEKILPVDVYFGGAEHTLGHTLYARFFTKFFKDLGLISFDEFALKRVQHGVILGPDGNRMSKSKGNVVNPDDIVGEYGADAVRVYLSFMMPYEATAPWSAGAISGIYRFLRRIWDLYDKVVDEENMSEEDLTTLNKTVKKVADDLDNIKFNTAVASIMTWLNHISRKEMISAKEYKTLLLILAPFAPHITEELWHMLHSHPERSEGSKDSSASPQNDKVNSIHLQSWPEVDSKYLEDETVVIAVQVNGKVRDTLEIKKDAPQAEVEKLALNSSKVQKFLEAKEPKKIIYVPGKILNIVV